MKFARCRLDGKLWESFEFSQLPTIKLETLRHSLYCDECEESAWFRKESKHGHPAHFCAHHSDDCSFKIEYIPSDNPRLQGTTIEDEVGVGDSIVVNLDQNDGGDIHVATVQPSVSPNSPPGGRVYVGKNGQRENSQQFTLRRVLHRLVQSPKFRVSSTSLIFYKNAEELLISGSVKNIVKSFDQVNSDSFLSDQGQFYWGAIASAGTTPDGKLWLNSGDNNLVSIVVFEDIVDDFLEAFEVDELEELAGAHVLVFGRCQKSGTGKRIVWCGSTKYIMVRKYNNA